MTISRKLIALAAVFAMTSATAALAGAARDTTFTVAVIPDTQNYIDYTHQKAENYPFDASEQFLQQMRYIAANARVNGGKTVFATSLGDTWQHQSLAINPAHAARGFKRIANPFMDTHVAPSPKTRSVEMPMARKGFEVIAGKLPFSVVPGNHDYDAVWTDVRYPPAAQFDLADMTTLGGSFAGGLENFSSVFGEGTPFFRGKDWYVASHDGGADSAQIFSAGGYRFLHIGLQFAAPNASLEWASDVIAKHPGLPTIISTHDFLNSAGERAPNPAIDHHKIDPDSNSPQLVWEKFVSRHDQIFMVLSGHHHGQAMRTDQNAFGHVVYQILADYQDRGQTAIDAGVPASVTGRHVGDGWMRLLNFDLRSAAPLVHVRTYSTYYHRFSTEMPKYAEWYRPREQPKMTDAEFAKADDYVIALTDFKTRFGEPKPE